MSTKQSSKKRKQPQPEATLESRLQQYYYELIRDGSTKPPPPADQLTVPPSVVVMALEDMLGISGHLGDRLRDWLEDPKELRAPIPVAVMMDEIREDDAEIEALVEAHRKENFGITAVEEDSEVEEAYKAGARPEDARKWSESDWRDSQGISLPLSCNHPKCRITKRIYCRSRLELRYAEKRIGQEIHYCAKHRNIAWDTCEDLPDYFLPALNWIKYQGSCNKSKAYLKPADIDFLSETGLIAVLPVKRGTQVGYEISITESGKQYLSKHADRLARYLSHQVKKNEDWYWVGTYTQWMFVSAE